jgi:hypothetical protein
MTPLMPASWAHDFLVFRCVRPSRALIRFFLLHRRGISSRCEGSHRPHLLYLDEARTHSSVHRFEKRSSREGLRHDCSHFRVTT